MASIQKFVVSTIAVFMILIALFASGISGSHSKIRIHVPVKHHTHFHTKTIVKTIHVPVKVKSNHHHHHMTDHHHVFEDDADVHEAWAKSFPKKKKIRPIFY